jgi:hypothetical protein
MAKIALFKFDKKGKYSVDVIDAKDYKEKISTPGLYYAAGLVEVVKAEEIDEVKETEKLMDEETNNE